MKQIDFNDSWKFKVQGDGEWKSVTLPHDAQLLAARSKDAPGGSGHAYFPGGIYEYEKQIEQFENDYEEIKQTQVQCIDWQSFFEDAKGGSLSQRESYLALAEALICSNQQFIDFNKAF